jgi:hypothetical protein
MAGNRPLRPGEQPTYGAPARPGSGQNRGNSGGGTRKKKKRGDSGLSEDDGGGSDGLSNEPTTAFAVQDPAAYLRGQMEQAGYAPNAATDYGRFLNDAIVNPFVSGWDEWKANNGATSDQDFFNFVGNRGMGLNPGQGAAPATNAFGGGSGVQINQEGAIAPPPMSFDDYVRQQTGQGVNQLNPNRRQRLREQFQASGGGAPGVQINQQGNIPPTPAAFTPAAPSPQNLLDFNAWLTNEVDKYTPMQQGRYDAGKRPGSIRYNLFS